MLTMTRRPYAMGLEEGISMLFGPKEVGPDSFTVDSQFRP